LIVALSLVGILGVLFFCFVLFFKVIYVWGGGKKPSHSKV
jgi:hypothetical protein